MTTEKPRILIVEARFYNEIADELAAGATEVLAQNGYAFDRLEVPGVFEIPAAVRFGIGPLDAAAPADTYAGFITLGCVIRGETDHYDHICRATSLSLMDLTTKYGIAHGFGVLTCENGDQAWARAKRDQKNLGGRAAETVVRMIQVKRELRSVSQ